jgi:hypothetical protein
VRLFRLASRRLLCEKYSYARRDGSRLMVYYVLHVSIWHIHVIWGQGEVFIWEMVGCFFTLAFRESVVGLAERKSLPFSFLSGPRYHRFPGDTPWHN